MLTPTKDPFNRAKYTSLLAGIMQRHPSLNDDKGFYPFFGVYTPFDPEDQFVTARFLSPKVFGFGRALIAVYSVVVIVIDIVFQGTMSLL